MRNKTFAIEGMVDEEDEALVERLLMTLEGVESAEADSMQGIVDITYDENLVGPKEMEELMNEYGFDFDK